MLHTMEFYFYFIYLICSWSPSCVIYLGGNIYLGVDLGPVFLNDMCSVNDSWYKPTVYEIKKTNSFLWRNPPLLFCLYQYVDEQHMSTGLFRWTSLRTWTRLWSSSCVTAVSSRRCRSRAFRSTWRRPRCVWTFSASPRNTFGKR